MNQVTVFVYADMGFVAKVPCDALLDLMRIRIPFFSLFLVEDGAEIMAQLTVPFFRIIPCWMSAVTA